MLSYSEALLRILRHVPTPRVETRKLDEVLGLVLAKNVQADMDVPPFDKSFMDGFAVDSRDLARVPAELEIVATNPAGRVLETSLQRGQAIRIMTGAPLPRGADAVQMVEKTELVGERRVLVRESVEPGQHIAPQASEVRAGSTVLEAGRILKPADIAVLATFGQAEVAVFVPPRVTLLATGDELVAIETQPGPGQIRNSNSHMLAAQCRLLGLPTHLAEPLSDDPDTIRQAIYRGLQEADLLIFSGGVSMGEFDFVHRALKAEDLEILFHKAAVKPGKPIIVGRLREQLIFGLPGNPVSALVTFQIFVKPAIEKWMGWKDHTPFLLNSELMEDIKHKSGRLFFAPAVTVSTPLGLQTRPVLTRGSADIVAFSRANSLLLVGADVEQIKAGMPVNVIPLAGCPGLPTIGFPS